MAETKFGPVEEPVVTSPPRNLGPPPPYPGPSSSPSVHVGATTVVFAEPIGPKPARTVCKSCQKEIITTTKPKVSTRTHLIAALFFISLLWPCIVIPYCVDSCRNIEHYCPNCDSYIGVYVN